MATNKTSFKKGQSGNPGGRPKERVTPDGQTLSQLARGYTAECLDVLREVYLSKATDPKDRIVAAQAMLTRGHGAPKPAADDTGEGDAAQPVNVTVTVSDARKPYAEPQ